MEPVIVTDVPMGPEVGDNVIEAAGFTVNVALAVAAPLAAVTVCAPTPDATGTLKLAVNEPVALAVTVAGLVVTALPSYVIATFVFIG